MFLSSFNQYENLLCSTKVKLIWLASPQSSLSLKFSFPLMDSMNHFIATLLHRFCSENNKHSSNFNFHFKYWYNIVNLVQGVLHPCPSSWRNSSQLSIRKLNRKDLTAIAASLQLFTSSLYLVALASTFAASYTTRTLGRKLTMLIAGVFFILNWNSFQCCSSKPSNAYYWEDFTWMWRWQPGILSFNFISNYHW